MNAGGASPVSNQAVYRELITVGESAIDANGHVNNVVFVQWMQDVAIRHFNSVVGMEPLRAAGAMWVVRSHHIEYLSPAFNGDQVNVLTWVVDFSRVRSMRRYKFIRAMDGKLLVRGETDWVFVNAGTGRPSSIPPSIRDVFPVLGKESDPN